MSKKILIGTGGLIIVIAFFILAYITFTVLGITHSDTKRYDLTIASESAEKIYDGDSLENNSWYVESGVLREGDSLEVTMPASLKNPGEIENTLGVTILDEENNNVTSNYDIEYNPGTLKVRGKPLQIRTQGEQKTYDGSTLSLEEWTLESGTLFEGHRMETVMSSRISHPGTKDNKIGVTILDEEDRDVTDKYDIDYDLGELVVNPIDIVLKSESASKVYDGEPLTKEEWELLNGSLMEGHELVVDVNGELTDVGNANNEMFAYVVNGEGENVSDYYDFEYIEGSLDVETSSYSSQGISKGMSGLSDEDVFKFYTDQPGTTYFRGESMGDYNKQGWNTAPEHDMNLSNSPLEFTGQALKDSAKSETTMQMEYLRNNVPYLLPYFSVNNLNTVDDILVEKNTDSDVSHTHIPYEFSESDVPELSSNSYVEDEATYKTHVYDTYLQIPSSTDETMKALALENGLDPSSETLVSDVKSYIQNAATYDMDFEIPDDVDDVVVYFLTESKEGICQHYAAAATMMYRSMGVPARYVTGYLGIAETEGWTTVNGEYAHAWVEIYIDGTGWMPIEVTGGGLAQGGTPTGETDPDKEAITVAPKDVREPYETDKVISPKDFVITGADQNLLKGHTFETAYEGNLSEPGLQSTSITMFTIYDADGEDVTDHFDITFEEGELQLYTQVIDLVTEDTEKVYDGDAFKGEAWDLNGTLEEEHYVETIEFHTEQTHVGTTMNKAAITIFDAEGTDVTGHYKINNEFGELSVKPRHITIQSKSDEKAFDGTPLINENYDVVSGELLSGDTLEVTVSGSQTNIGKSDNTIEDFQIMNNNEEVTKNYSINVIEGELTVKPG